MKIPTLFIVKFLCMSILLGICSVYAIELNVKGDSLHGFYLEVSHGGRPLLKSAGEFSIRLFNTDQSEVVEIQNWKAENWLRQGNRIQLFREHFLSELDLKLRVIVTYEIINDHLLGKKIELRQNGMPKLYYILEENNFPAEPPIQYLTFEYDSFPGGLVHEIYPSAGFITRDGNVIGFLMDSGFRNHYTRTTRRRFNGHGGGFVGMRKLPDPELVRVASPADQQKGNHYVRRTFGQMYNLDAGRVKPIQPDNKFKTIGNVDVTGRPGGVKMKFSSQERSGIEYQLRLEQQQVYTISFSAKGTATVALKLFRLRNGKKTYELEHGIKYIDNFPVKKDQWTPFLGSVLLPYIEGDSIALFLGAQNADGKWLEVKDLNILRHYPKIEPYNFLPMGQTISKSTFIFVEPFTNHRQFVISSQTRLSEGLGFQGTTIEKMLYGNLQMLTWITAIDDFTPFNVPNLNYAPDMYNRDSFFSITATYDKELNLGIWEKWGRTQESNGAIGTIITPYMGSVEVKDNEATIHWLIWAMLNKRRFLVDLPEEKIRSAVEYVLKEFDSDGDGRCRSHFTLSQIDVIDYHPKTDRLAVNQGMFAVALRTIKQLGFEISEAYIRKAESAYREFYDPKRKHLLFDREYPDIITLTDLEPEFFSLWLFGRPMLEDSVVINHLEQIPLLNKSNRAPHPELGTTAPICIKLLDGGAGFSYLTPEYQPFGEFGKSAYQDRGRDGFYYNGGSWFRAEYCAYVVGLLHGWEKARKLMKNRVWAEMYLNPDMPFSKEFIPTHWDSYESWWLSTRGLCWNVFVLMANEVAGFRSPQMDPNYSK